MLFFILEIIYPRIPGALPPQDFLLSAAPEDILSLYTKYLVNLSIWAVGILALIMLVYGGILYLFSTGKPEAMVTARNQITSAFFGLLLVLSSFLILNTLSPQFISLKIPTLQTVQFPQKPIIPLPKITAINSSIDIEMPFARIIEKIFETYISDYPTPDPAPTPRLERIKDNANTTKTITDKLLSQSEDLKEAADSCACGELDPCCWLSNPPPACQNNTCSSKPGCTSDPCKGSPRKEIQKIEEKNKTEINNLTAQQIKTEEEIRSLKEWLDRLKRAEKFIKECPLRNLNSLAQFYSKKDTFDKQKWAIRETKFWDDISIRYYLQNIYGSPTKYLGTDFATFYCAVSGTTEQQPSYAAPDLTGEESEETLSEAMACSSEAPVGEIIDRAKRTTQLLINKLQQLIGKDKELIKAVDELQVSVSKCSSQRCFSQCVCIPCTKECCTCQGGNCCCQCIKKCVGDPCPSAEINKQLEKIQEIWGEIKDIIEGKAGKDAPDNIGIATIIDEVVPEILKDLGTAVRIPMKGCSSENWLEQDTVLFNCAQTIGATAPGGRVIRLCCQTEAWDNNTGKIEQTVYGDCFEECYLKKGLKEHRECVQKCLNGLSVMLGDPEIAKCTPELNFYCCHQK